MKKIFVLLSLALLTSCKKEVTNCYTFKIVTRTYFDGQTLSQQQESDAGIETSYTHCGLTESQAEMEINPKHQSIISYKNGIKYTTIIDKEFN